jgi:imidazolonepropionase
MTQVDLVIRGVRVVSPTGPARGKAMGALRITERADVAIDRGRIVEATRETKGRREIKAGGRVLLPGFIDAHTHALWAGDRLDEWDRKRAGATYLEILKGGGGIMSTVRAVRKSSQSDLEANLRERLGIMLREGTTTVEVKSGYGLTTADELKMLRAIKTVGAEREAPTVVATALLGHALDPDVPADRFVRTVIEETLPAVHAEFPGIAVDAYCEEGAWSLAACIRLFEKAVDLGHPIRVHTDQFNALGMTQWAVAHGALSVDHLEASTGAILDAVGASKVWAGLLPCAGFHTDGRYASGRRVIDAGGGVVIATNCNPGSAPCSNMPMAIALAVRNNGLTPSEANAAALLGFNDRGVIAPGMRADLVLLRHRDERMLAFEFGGDPVDMVVAGGRVIREGGIG